MANDAAQCARHMQRWLGWWPYDSHNVSDWQMYCEVHARAQHFLRARGIGPNNAHAVLQVLSEYARAESEPLFQYVAAAHGSQGLRSMLTSPSACQAYILATLFSMLGSSAEHAAEERLRAQRPHWQERSQYRARGGRGGRSRARPQSVAPRTSDDV